MQRDEAAGCIVSFDNEDRKGSIGGVVADGGNTSKVESKLAACNISTVLSTTKSYTALCSDGSAVSWGDRNCMLHV